MLKNETLEQRIDAGRKLRKTAPRATHNMLGNIKRDPIPLLQSSSEGRFERLVPLRYGRMLASPFAFYRGSAAIQAHDLAPTPQSGLQLQICGDAHLMNFGGFATPERNLVFDMNDFDETHPGPWEWDVKRLAASISVAARHLGFKDSAADDMVFNAVEHYRLRMSEFAQMSELDLWYEKLTFDEMLTGAVAEDSRKQIHKAIEKASMRTHEGLLPKMAEKIDGRWRMRDAPPELFHFRGAHTLLESDDPQMAIDVKRDVLGSYFTKYLATLSWSHQQLLKRFSFQDAAFKVVGVGSVGTYCHVLLFTDIHDQPLFLQAKQAQKSVLAPYVKAGKPAFNHEGQRIVQGQRMLQSASDMFLGWTTGYAGRNLYVRQLRDMKVSFEIDTFSEFLLGRYAWLCFHVLARAHARASGMAPQISGYLGKSGQFAEALAGYARGYTDQVESDFEAFRAACRKGRITAQSEADFGADLRA